MIDLSDDACRLLRLIARAYLEPYYGAARPRPYGVHARRFKPVITAGTGKNRLEMCARLSDFEAGWTTTRLLPLLGELVAHGVLERGRDGAGWRAPSRDHLLMAARALPHDPTCDLDEDCTCGAQLLNS